jgi:hypothetical protein
MEATGGNCRNTAGKHLNGPVGMGGHAGANAQLTKLVIAHAPEASVGFREQSVATAASDS